MIPAGFSARMILVLVRAIDEYKCQMAVTCCGGDSGLRYFPVYHDGLGEQRLNPLIFDDVSRGRIETTTFWIELLKQLVVPEKKSGGAKFVFGTLLPFLNDTPIESQMNVRQMQAVFRMMIDSEVPWDGGICDVAASSDWWGQLICGYVHRDLVYCKLAYSDYHVSL